MSRADEIMGINASSEDEGGVYGSSDEEQSRSKQFKPSAKAPSKGEDEDEDSEAEVEANSADEAESNRVLREEESRRLLKQSKKSGVVYLSSIPPYMKPVKVKQVLERFGEVGRIYLAPEDPKAYSRRVKSGGNRKKKFVEGWAEYLNKKNAKLAVEALNGHPLGGKKGSFYYDDIMNLKYLPKFKWHDLTEQIALEVQERQEKLKAEIAQATRENSVFIENVEKKERLDRKKRKADELDPSVIAEEEQSFKRTFSQKPAKANKRFEKTDKNLAALSNVLSKVF